MQREEHATGEKLLVLIAQQLKITQTKRKNENRLIKQKSQSVVDRNCLSQKRLTPLFSQLFASVRSTTAFLPYLKGQTAGT